MSDNSPHHECTAHSGMMAKLNVNLVLHALAVILLGFLVNNTMDIKTGQALAEAKMQATDIRISNLEDRIEVMEGLYRP